MTFLSSFVSGGGGGGGWKKLTIRVTAVGGGGGPGFELTDAALDQTFVGPDAFPDGSVGFGWAVRRPVAASGGGVTSGSIEVGYDASGATGPEPAYIPSTGAQGSFSDIAGGAVPNPDGAASGNSGGLFSAFNLAGVKPQVKITSDVNVDTITSFDCEVDFWYVDSASMPVGP